MGKKKKKKFKVGDEVIAVTMGNSYAEFVLANENFVALKPKNISFEEGTYGVFLLTDDQNIQPVIGMTGEIVVRRIYSQEGQIRYGTKVQLN